MTKQNSIWSKALIMLLTIWNCVLSYKKKNYFSKKSACSSKKFLAEQNSQVATFCYLHFFQVANGIFRWHICYLLLLISNPDNTHSQYPWLARMALLIHRPLCQIIITIINPCLLVHSQVAYLVGVVGWCDDAG